jgi:hypothetical protein
VKLKSTKFYLVVDSDVSLASVAKDLGFDGRELTDMLEKLPVEDPFESEIEPDEENLLTCKYRKIFLQVKIIYLC